VPPKNQSLGELELEILKVVWARQPCTVSDVVDVLAERRGSARTTVLTVMQRLLGKGFLRRRLQDGVHLYSTVRKKNTVVGGLIHQFVDTVLDGSVVPFVNYLAESKGLSAEQLETLRGIARELDGQAKGE
jgi:predicted transcriptional regulator